VKLKNLGYRRESERERDLIKINTINLRNFSFWDGKGTYLPIEHKARVPKYILFVSFYISYIRLLRNICHSSISMSMLRSFCLLILLLVSRDGNGLGVGREGLHPSPDSPFIFFTHPNPHQMDFSKSIPALPGAGANYGYL